MVHCFLIHTVTSGPCKILFSRMYGNDIDISEFTASRESDEEAGDDRTARRQMLASVAERVQSEYSFSKSAAATSIDEEMRRFLTEKILPNEEVGFFRLPKREPFSNEKTVIWMGCLYYGFTLVCERNESRMFAELALKNVIWYLKEHLEIFNQPVGIFHRPDQIAHVVDQFLPGGQLIIMNHRVVRQCEKNLEIVMKS